MYISTSHTKAIPPPTHTSPNLPNNPPVSSEVIVMFFSLLSPQIWQMEIHWGMSMASFESHSPVGSITNSIRRYSTPSALLGAQSSSFSESIHSAQPVTVLPEAEESLDPPGGSINSHSAADSLEPALSSSSHDAEVLQNEASLRGARVRHYLTLTMLCCSNISSAMYGSLLAPFFPTEVSSPCGFGSCILCSWFHWIIANILQFFSPRLPERMSLKAPSLASYLGVIL